MTRTCCFFAFTLWTLSAAADPVRLRGLVATSGAGVERVLDGDDTKGWQPPGRATKEGITFAFEEPTKIDKVAITPCESGGSALVYCDGSYRTAAGTKVLEASCGDQPVRTVFVQIVSDSFCVGEVRFTQGGAALAVAPPRTVAASFDASSTLAPAEAFHPSFLFDGRLDFGWAEGAPSSGEKESVTVRFDAAQTVSALEVWNGYQRSDDHFAKNARAKTVTVSGDGGQITLQLADKSGPQKPALDPPIVGKTLKITVDAVYPGKKYKDLVLSELRFFDAKGPFMPASSYREEKQKQFIAAHKATPANAVLDAPLTTMCSANTGSLKLRSNASFIADFTEDEAVDATTERSVKRVIEGAWVPAAAAKDGALVFDLYAKQYLSRATFRAYGKSSKKETVGIIGGKHKLYDFASMSDAAYAALVETWKAPGGEAFLACGNERGRAGLAKEKIVFISGPVFNDFFVAK